MVKHSRHSSVQGEFSLHTITQFSFIMLHESSFSFCYTHMLNQD